MSRRAALAGLLALGIGGCRSKHTGALLHFQFEQAQMGLPFRIVLYAESQAHADTAARNRLQHWFEILRRLLAQSRLR